MEAEKYTETIDEEIQMLAEVYADSKEFAEKNGYGNVHIVKIHYKDLKDGTWKDTWRIDWDNDEGRIAFMDECAAHLFEDEALNKKVV